MNPRLISSTGSWLIAQQEPQRLIERLEPVERAQVILLLLFIIILGVGLVLFAWLWGRSTRRMLRRLSEHKPRPRDEDDWASKPLVPSTDPLDTEDEARDE